MELHVLIVDDSTAMRSFIRHVLELSGLRVGKCLEAANGVLHSLGLETFPLAPYPEPEWLAAGLQNAMLGARAALRRWRGLPA